MIASYKLLLTPTWDPVYHVFN